MSDYTNDLFNEPLPSPTALFGGFFKDPTQFDTDGFLRPGSEHRPQHRKNGGLKVVTDFDGGKSKPTAVAAQPSPATRALTQFLNLNSPKTPTSPVVGLYVDTPRSRHRCGRKLDGCQGGCTGHGFGGFIKSPTSPENKQLPPKAQQQQQQMASEPKPSPGIFASPNGSVYKKLWSPGQPKAAAQSSEQGSLMRKLMVKRVQEAESAEERPAKTQRKSDDAVVESTEVMMQGQVHTTTTTTGAQNAQSGLDAFGFSVLNGTASTSLNDHANQLPALDMALTPNTAQFVSWFTDPNFASAQTLDPLQFAPQAAQQSMMQQQQQVQPLMPAIMKNPNSSKPFPCPYQPECNHAFSRRHDLIRHLRIHNNEKPFRCDRCYKAFTRMDALTRHVKISEKYGGRCRNKRGRVPKDLSPLQGTAVFSMRMERQNF